MLNWLLKKAAPASLSALIVSACVSAPPGKPVRLALQVSCGHAVTEGPNRNFTRGTFEGRNAMRFRLAAEDAGRCRADIARGNYSRAELRSDYLPRNRRLSVTFDVYIPDDFAATGGIAIGQLHQKGLKPMILLQASREGYRVTPGSALKTSGATLERRQPLLVRQQFRRWNRIVMEARFSRGDNGYIRVSANDVLAFEATGPTVDSEPYFKIGLYGQSDRIAAPLTVFVTDPVLTFMD